MCLIIFWRRSWRLKSQIVNSKTWTDKKDLYLQCEREFNGSRKCWKDGWKANVFHCGRPFLNTKIPGLFLTDLWQLPTKDRTRRLENPRKSIQCSQSMVKFNFIIIPCFNLADKIHLHDMVHTDDTASQPTHEVIKNIH